MAASLASRAVNVWNGVGALLASAALVVVQLLVGLGLAGFAIPPVLQVVHLLVGSLLMGTLTALALLAWRLPVSAGERPETGAGFASLESSS